MTRPLIDLRAHYRGIFGDAVMPGRHLPKRSTLTLTEQAKRKRRRQLARKSRATNRRRS